MEGRDEDLIDLAVRLPRELIETVILEQRQPIGDPAGRRLALARWILASRRRRPKFLAGIKLGEPCWDMILDLYVAHRENREIDVSSFCLASGVAPTTALRYVDLLVDDGYIAREEDLQDGRRAFIRIKEKLQSAIEAWLDQADGGLTTAGLISKAGAISDQAGDADHDRTR